MCGGGPTVHTITISASNANPKPPTLTDEKGLTSSTDEGDRNFTTLVSNGQLVKWVKGGDVTDITGINQESGSNLFTAGPAKQSDGSWLGTIGNLAANSQESYSISYTVNGQNYTQDPKLKMH